MENMLIDALKINDLKMVGASSVSQNTDNRSNFESILQGLLGSGKEINLPKQTVTAKKTETNGQVGLKDNLNALSEIIEKISKLLEANDGELDISALEELLGRSLNEDEISLFQLIANKDFSIEELQAALFDGDNAELQAMGLTIDSDTEEPLNVKIEKLISGLDDIIKEIKQSLENNLNNPQVVSEDAELSQENLKGLLAVFESVKGKLQQINNTLEQGFAASTGSVFEGYDDVDQVKKTFWTTIDQLMGNKSEKGGDGALSNLLSNEIISNEDLRDLRKNIETLLQNRQSLQKLFTSENASDRKFVSAVLNYADALKNNKGKTAITALAKNLAVLNQETSNTQTITIGNSLYKELFANTDKTTEETLKTEQTGKTIDILKTGLTDNNNDTTGKQNNNNPNNHFNLNNVQVLKSETTGSVNSNTSVNQSSILNQVSEKINLTLNRGESKVTIQLNPPELGKLNVNLTMRNNQLQAVMIAESVQVKNILELNMNQLKVALEGQNIEVDKVSVFVGNEDSNFASFLREQKNSKGQKQNLKPFEDNLEPEKTENIPKVIITDKSENLDLFV